MKNELTHIATSTSVEQTRKIASILATISKPQDVITLDGDLGAGKTHFTQGFGKGLSVQSEVVSPTFTLMQAYTEGRIPLYHFDLYRLDDPYELEDIGFYEYIESDGVSVIEWASKFEDELPEDYLALTISVLDETTRSIDAQALGCRSKEMLEQWINALGDYVCAI